MWIRFVLRQIAYGRSIECPKRLFANGKSCVSACALRHRRKLKRSWHANDSHEQNICAYVQLEPEYQSAMNLFRCNWCPIGGQVTGCRVECIHFWARRSRSFAPFCATCEDFGSQQTAWLLISSWSINYGIRSLHGYHHPFDLRLNVFRFTHRAFVKFEMNSMIWLVEIKLLTSTSMRRYSFSKIYNKNELEFGVFFSWKYLNTLTPLAFQMLTNFSNTIVPSPHNTYATDSICSAKSISFSSLSSNWMRIRIQFTQNGNLFGEINLQWTYVRRPLRCSIHLSCGNCPTSSISNNLKKFNRNGWWIGDKNEIYSEMQRP